jgi:hypothetical protein
VIGTPCKNTATFPNTSVSNQSKLKPTITLTTIDPIASHKSIAWDVVLKTNTATIQMIRPPITAHAIDAAISLILGRKQTSLARSFAKTSKFERRRMAGFAVFGEPNSEPLC